MGGLPFSGEKQGGVNERGRGEVRGRDWRRGGRGKCGGNVKIIIIIINEPSLLKKVVMPRENTVNILPSPHPAYDFVARS